jgi:capsular polysaccharide biosynthesis protein
MTRSDVAGFVRRHGALVGVLTLAGLVGAIAVVLLQLAGVPPHRATAALLASAGGSSILDQRRSVGEDPTAQPVSPVVGLATTPLVLRPVIDELELPLTVSQLARRVSASERADSGVVEVSVSGDSSSRAVAIADAVADRLVAVAGELRVDGPAGLRLTRIQRARPDPSGALDLLPVLAAGPLLGLLAGFVVAGLQEPRREPGWGRLAVH